MLYDFTELSDREDAFNRVQKFIQDKKDVVEITVKNQQGKTVSQNSYREVLISLFAIEIGETKEYIREYVFKEMVNKEIFKTEYENTKKGYRRDEWKSCRDLTKEETSTTIERFRNFASKKGVYLLSSEEYKQKKVGIDKYIHKHKEYL